ncbi:hypothetical protein ACHAXS_013440 [Conticribra weissflogii]
MSEGGIYPWKLQKIQPPPNGGRPATCRYSDLKNPLPPPPKGLVWVQVPDASTGSKEWKLVPVAEATPAADSLDERNSIQDDHESSAVPIAAARPVANASNPRDTTAVATASVASGEAFVAVPVINIGQFSNDDNPREEDDTYENGIHYHQVTNSDTLQGLCLKYKISALDLRRANKFVGQINLRYLVGERIVIPPSKDGKQRNNDQTGNGTMTKEEKIASLLTQYQCKVSSIGKQQNSRNYDVNGSNSKLRPEPLSHSEARAYLELNDWSLNKARENVWEDFGWR